MSSDFCYVTFPPPSPSTPEIIQGDSLEEDADLAKLVEDFMGATRLQISLRQRIESSLEKKAKEAQEQEEKARVAWVTSQARTRAIQESTDRLRGKMKLAEDAGRIETPIIATRSDVLRPPAVPTFPRTSTTPVYTALIDRYSVTPVRSPSPRSMILPPVSFTGASRSPRMSGTLNLIEPGYIEPCPSSPKKPTPISMASGGNSLVGKPAVINTFATLPGLFDAQAIAPELAEVCILDKPDPIHLCLIDY
jgi:hypothetical protein